MSSISRQLSELGKLFQVNEYFYTLPIADNTVQVAQKNALRWALLFAPGFGPAGSVALSTDQNGPFAGQGLPCSQTIQGQQIAPGIIGLDFRNWGPLVQSAWWLGWYSGSSRTGPNNITVWEVTLLTGS